MAKGFSVSRSSVYSSRNIQYPRVFTFTTERYLQCTWTWSYNNSIYGSFFKEEWNTGFELFVSPATWMHRIKEREIESWPFEIAPNSSCSDVKSPTMVPSSLLILQRRKLAEYFEWRPLPRTYARHSKASHYGEVKQLGLIGCKCSTDKLVKCSFHFLWRILIQILLMTSISLVGEIFYEQTISGWWFR